MAADVTVYPAPAHVPRPGIPYPGPPPSDTNVLLVFFSLYIICLNHFPNTLT